MWRHDEGDHLLVFEGGSFTYLSVPPLHSQSVAEDGKLCFLDHQLESWDPLSEMCCLREAGHVHAHVHRGEIIEDVFLEQCLEEAGCTLPMPWDLGSMLTPLLNVDQLESDHEHGEGCGHNRIAHGDHYDWLLPLEDGSYVLSHDQRTAKGGGSQFIEHGRLVKVGESFGQLKEKPKQLVHLFTYESPGYQSLLTVEVPGTIEPGIVGVVRSPRNSCLTLSSSKQGVVQEDLQLTIPRGFNNQGMTKTTFDVMGICCPSEVPLVKRILGSLPGVEEVLVNPTAKTATVVHDPAIVTDVQLVKILNEARLDASIQQRGRRRTPHKWPSPWTIGSGILLAVSFLNYAWSPLKWVALGSVAVGLPPIVVRSLVALRRCLLDINALMLIAVGGSIALGDYVEAGSIAFLFTLADWLESRSSEKARDAVANVADLAPQTAVLMDGQRVSVEDVKVGTFLAVKAGELIPIDGEVVSGKSSVDESNVTGESKPVEKTTGAVVWAGTMNLSGYISVKTTALAEDSAVARMVRLVEEAQNQHSPTERLVERVAKFYTPIVVVSAALIAVIPWAAGSHRHKHWIKLALVLLVVACPCALVISTPVTTTCGIAQAARAGLLVRGGRHLEALAKVRVVAMDKTGTLTEGHFRVLDVHPVDENANVQQILYWIACVESKSSHPLAPALVAYARLQGVEPTGDITDFEIIPGTGVSALVDGHRVQIGNARLAATFAGFQDYKSGIVGTWSSLGATVGWVGVDGRQVGVFAVADSLRAEAREAVASLKKLGLKVVMLTGDSSAAAAAAHDQLGDIEVHAELLPEDKVELVKSLKAENVTAMVGDGINDAPALALSDVGIAMGVAGSAVAMETADVALMTNDLRKLAVSIKLGRTVRRKIIQNVSVSFVTKFAIIALAVAGHPSLWAAVLADVGTCLLVIFNSMRILNRKKGVVLPKFESKKQHKHKHGHHNHLHDDSHHGHDHNHHHHHDHDHKHGHHGHLNGDCHHETDLNSHHEHKHGHHNHGECLHAIDHNSHHHHHQELGEVESNIQNHPHDLHHQELGNAGDNHLELGKSDDDHHHHNHHGVKVLCWRRHRHGHGSKDTEKVICSEPVLTSQPNKASSKANYKVSSRSVTSSKSRKCCTKAGLANNSCPENMVILDKECSMGLCQDAKCCSKSKKSEKPISATAAAIDSCCTKAGIENRCSSDISDSSNSNRCCTGPDEDTRSCSKVNQEVHSSPVADTMVILGKECCSTQDAKCCSKSKNLQKPVLASTAAIINGCCTKPGPENRFSSDIGNSLNSNKCCTGPAQDTRSCSKVNQKVQSSPNADMMVTFDEECCMSSSTQDVKCCSKSKKIEKSISATTAPNSGCCTKNGLKDRCSSDIGHSLTTH